MCPISLAPARLIAPAARWSAARSGQRPPAIMKHGLRAIDSLMTMPQQHKNIPHRHAPNKALRIAAASLAITAALVLAGCAEQADQASQGDGDAATETETEASKTAQKMTPDAARPDSFGTPMAERIATIGFLNKRNNESRDLEMKPGESRRIGNVVIKMEACERTAPWESPSETGAFVQVTVQDRKRGDEAPKWRRVFSGWLFKESPSVSVVEHPIYDVWVKNCAMRFPGEEEPLPGSDDDAAAGAGSAAPSQSDNNAENAAGNEGAAPAAPVAGSAPDPAPAALP